MVSDFPQPPRSCLALSPAEKRVLTASPAHWPYSLEVDLPQVSSPAINYNSQLNPWQTPPTLFLSHSLSSVLVYQWLCFAPVLLIICSCYTDLLVSFSPQLCVPEGDMTGCGKTFSSAPPCLPGLPVLLGPAQEGQGSSPYSPRGQAWGPRIVSQEQG